MKYFQSTDISSPIANIKTFKGMSVERLKEIVSQFPRIRIAVLGDFFLDKYLEVDPTLAETSVETGKIAHQVVNIRHSPGAAGTVVSNLSALGVGELHAIGFTGDDGEGYELRRDLAVLRCQSEHLHCDSRRRTPTYLKPRDKNDPTLAGEHNRYDTKNRDITPNDLQEKIVRSLEVLVSAVDAIIVMDQVEQHDCGVVTSTVVAALAKLALEYPNVIFWADSRRRIREYRHVIIKPNQFEAIGHENPLPDETVELDRLVTAVEELRAKTGSPVYTTLGATGILVTDQEMIFVPGVKLTCPTDPTGAGDSATAGAVAALAAGATLPEAALIANLVASITVTQLATTGVARPEQLPERLVLWQKQQAEQ